MKIRRLRAPQAQLLLAFTLVLVSVEVSSAQTNTFPSSGSAGVGTTTPESVLTIQSTGPDSGGEKYVRVKNTNSFTGLLLDPNQSGDAKWILMGGYPNVGDFTIREFGVANYFTIKKTTGNIGIGTTSPTTVLDINGALRLRQNPGGNAAASLIELGDRHAGWGMGFTWNLYFDGAAWRNRTADYGAILGFGDGTNQGDLLFWNSPYSSAGSTPSLTERFRITNSGNVGIGTSNPTYKLDVNGEINATGIRINGTPISGGGGGSQWTGSNPIYYSSGNVGIGTSSPGARLHISAGDSSVALFGPNSTWGGSLAVGSGADLLTPIAARAQVLSSNGNLHLDAGVGQLLYLGWLTPTNTIINGQGGNVGVGTSSPTEKLHVVGNGKFTGNLTVDGNLAAKYQDVAEWVPSTEQLPAGTVVVLDVSKSNQVTSSTQAYDTRVAGVISTQPGITLGEKSDDKVLVATTGRVRVKVDASRAPIAIGDLLVTSDISGVAMKSEAVNLGGVQIHRPGTIIGKALEPLLKGSGEILVLLSLQ